MAATITRSLTNPKILPLPKMLNKPEGTSRAAIPPPIASHPATPNIPPPIASHPMNSLQDAEAYLASNVPLPTPGGARPKSTTIGRGRGKGMGGTNRNSMTNMKPVIPPKPVMPPKPKF